MSRSLPRWNLHELLKSVSYRHAVFTTYAFTPRFFEQIALEKFRALRENGNISVIIDNQVFATLISRGRGADDFPRRANLRYLLHPVRVPGNFHSKMCFLADKDRGLLIAGSANLTRDGLSANAELVSVFQFQREKDERALPIFKSSFEYLRALQRLQPADAFDSNLNAIEREATWLASPEEQDAKLPILLNNIDRPLWEQLREQIGTDSVEEVHILSRYFDSSPELLDQLYEDFSPRLVVINTQNTITTMTARWIAHASVRAKRTQLRLCRYSDRDHAQPLHAKAIAFVTKRGTRLAIGSANFSSAALRRTIHTGNAELLLVYPALKRSEFSASTFFDPDHTGVDLRDPAQLISAPEADADSREAPTHRAAILREAYLEGDKLILRLTTEQPPKAARCFLEQAEGRPMSASAVAAGPTRMSAVLTEFQLSHLRRTATVVRLEIARGEGATESTNEILLSNLQDLATGRNLRRERQIAEARESPAKFISLLNELCESGDDERLQQFLTYCNIPLELQTKLVRRFSPRDLSGNDDVHRLKTLGVRNIRQFQSLHEAIIAFVHRHRLRLQRHVDRGTAEGIPNFAQILLTVAGLLINQIERLVSGLESQPVVELKADEWHSIRTRLAEYYVLLENLLELTATEYVERLLEAYPLAKTKQRLLEHLADVSAVWSRALLLREVLNKLQKERLRVLVPSGTIAGPGFFKTVLSDEKWIVFKFAIQDLRDALAKRLAA